MSMLKISDAEFIFAEKVLKVYLEKLITIATEYSKEVSAIPTDALHDQEISNKLIDLSDAMQTILTDLETVQTSLKGRSKIFINEIDKLDKFIY